MNTARAWRHELPNPLAGVRSGAPEGPPLFGTILSFRIELEKVLRDNHASLAPVNALPGE